MSDTRSTSSPLTPHYPRKRSSGTSLSKSECSGAVHPCHQYSLSRSECSGELHPCYQYYWHIAIYAWPTNFIWSLFYGQASPTGSQVISFRYDNSHWTNSLLGPTSKPNLSTSPTPNTNPSTHPCLVHTHNFISTPQQHTLTSTPSPSNIKTPENQGELFDSQTLSKPRAPHVETKDELLSDFLVKKSGKKGKGGSSPKTWKRTDSIVNKKSGDSSDEVCYS